METVFKRDELKYLLIISGFSASFFEQKQALQNNLLKMRHCLSNTLFIKFAHLFRGISNAWRTVYRDF